MAVSSIKSTYSLDSETVRLLSATARRWGVSKSEVLRRAIRAVAAGPASHAQDPLAALQTLDRFLHLLGGLFERLRGSLIAHPR